MPTYNANIPQPSDQISQSQDQILQNFQSIQALIDVNHVDFASGNMGKHIYSTYVLQGSIPPITYNAGELAVYNATNPTTLKNELYVNKTNQATVVQVPSTASSLSITSAPAQNAGMWTYLPSGIIMFSGSATGNSGLTTVTLPTGVGTAPTLTQILSVIIGPYFVGSGDFNFAVRLAGILNPSQFQVYISSRTGTGPATGGFQFLAIGY